jgi:hypothetical protein
MPTQDPRDNSNIMEVPEHDPSTPGLKTTNEVRQGVTGHGVRYVLAISLGLALVGLFVAWSALT